MKKIITLFLTLILVFSLSACKDELPEGCSYASDSDIVTCTEQYLNYFDTLITLTIYYEDEKTAEDLDIMFDNVSEIFSTYHDISDKYNLYTDVTNIKTINDEPTATHQISDELYDLIDYSLNHQEEVDNLFNISLGPVLDHWHLYRENCDIYSDDTNCTLPLYEDLVASSAYIDSDDITLDSTSKTITLKENMSLDVGGVAKGYASDKVVAYLDTLDIRGYILNNGLSNISIGGTHPTRDGGEFLIGITDPINNLDSYLYLYVSDGDQVITSGDYQQYGITDGEIYHHIIDPTTLYPSNYSHSITLISNDASLGDIYSTALFSMSVEDGLDFVNSHDDLEAVWYSLDGTVYYSENFESNYTRD